MSDAHARSIRSFEFQAINIRMRPVERFETHINRRDRGINARRLLRVMVAPAPAPGTKQQARPIGHRATNVPCGRVCT